MLRYLSAAFRAPLNLLGLAAAAVAGFFAPEYWIAGGVAEFILLTTLATNTGFRHWIDTRWLATLDEDTEGARHRLLSSLGGTARQRYVRIEEKRTRLEHLSQKRAANDLLYDSNRDALRKLTWLYLQLLITQRNLIVAVPKATPEELTAQIAKVERQTASEAREATLRLLRQRQDNLRQREESLAQIEADLGRIEAQIDLALEETALDGQPASLSANVELTSQLLDNVSPQREIER